MARRRRRHRNLGKAAWPRTGGRSSGRQECDLRADIKDSKSIRALFEKTGKVDAVICTTGSIWRFRQTENPRC
jgi:hypothetical protein